MSGTTPPDPSKMSTAEAANAIEDVDDPDVLSDMLERELDGEDRSAVKRRIRDRMTEVQGPGGAGGELADQAALWGKAMVYLLVLVGLFFAGQGAISAGDQVMATLNTETTTGTVVSARVVTERTAGNNIYHYPTITYRYTVDGIAHESSGVYPGGKFSGGEPTAVRSTKAESLVRNYHEGKEITVHYDPAEPSRTFLELRLLVPAVFLVVGTGLIGVVTYFTGREFLYWPVTRIRAALKS